jgi:shikimate kinase
MAIPSNVILIGFMGSGKTSSGRELARRMGFRFLDLDERIQAKAGKSIDEIFRIEGETSFRAKERQEVDAITKQNHTIICPGGGAWLDERNRETLLRSGWCVWLEVSPVEAWRRIQADSNLRPLIHRSGDPSKEIRKLLEERNPIYALAHQKVETDGMLAEEVAGKILLLLKEIQPFPWVAPGPGR